MFIRRAEVNWWVLHFSTFIPGINSSLEKLRNEGSTDTDDDVLDDEANKDMDNNAVNGPTVLAHVDLARTVCKYIVSTFRL
jgi:hypothetical protein